MGRWILNTYIFIFLAVGNFAHGWGSEGHKLINGAAARSVDGDFGVFLAYFADTLAEHGPDPDAWKKADDNEGYRHYFDVDLYTDYPFANLPETEQQLVAEFGQKNVQERGICPYYIVEYSQKVIELLKDDQWTDVLIPLAALGHYVADLHMPLHVVENYNGQLTGNKGVHFQWEVSMVDKYIKNIPQVHSYPVIDDPLATCFKIVRESYTAHGIILRADSIARAEQPLKIQALLKGYEPLPASSNYLELLYQESGDCARNRMEEAAAMIAGFWYYCWDQAGRPTPDSGD